ncbi:MAG: hypothetical protein Q9166_006793 [cf. Caloplaca sp. 2 TL-2023]
MNGLSVDFYLSDHFFAETFMNTTGTGALLSIRNVGWGSSLINFTKISIGHVSGNASSVLGSGCFFQNQAVIAGCLRDLRSQLGASECALYWCINRYSAVQRSGVLKEDYIDSWWSNSSPNLVNRTDEGLVVYQHRYMQLLPSIGDGVVGVLKQNTEKSNPEGSSVRITHQVPTHYRTCYVEYEIHNDLSRWLASFFTTTLTYVENSINTQNHDEASDTAIVLSGVKGRPAEKGVPLLDPVFNIFSDVARGLTQSIRLDPEIQMEYIQGADKYIHVDVKRPPNEKSSANVTANSTALGAMFEDRAIVRVRWGWLAFPVGLVAMTALLTISTKIKSTKKHLPVWSSSTTALMMRGPYSRTDDILSITDSARAMQRKAERTKVVFERGANDCWKISKHGSPVSRSNPADLESASSILPNSTIPGMTKSLNLSGADGSLTVNTIPAATEPERKEETPNIFNSPPSVRLSRPRSI